MTLTYIPPTKRRSRTKLSVHHAASMADEDRSWKCESCTRMLEPTEERWCWQCRSYWEDCANGLFDDAEAS